jgi:hypothetical protein
MTPPLAAVVMAVHLHAATPVIPPDWAANKPALDQAAIRTAVREVLDEDRAKQAEQARRHEVDTLRADVYQRFAADFAEARVPDCLHPDGLKRQPTGIGPFQLAGLLALPFVAIAKLRGKCN